MNGKRLNIEMNEKTTADIEREEMNIRSRYYDLDSWMSVANWLLKSDPSPRVHAAPNCNRVCSGKTEGWAGHYGRGQKVVCDSVEFSPVVTLEFRGLGFGRDLLEDPS